MPSQIIISQGIRDAVREDITVLGCTSELSSLYEYYIPGIEGREALENKILKFAKTQALRVAFRKSFNLLKQDIESDETWAKIYEVYRDAVTVEHQRDNGLDYFNTLDERYAQMAEEMEQAERFTTGFEILDNALTGGGASRGEIYAWMGLPGSGKSLALVTCAVKNLMQGKKVLYITCEMSKEKVAERFDAQLANENINQLYERKDSVISNIREHVEDLEDKRQLVIQQYAAGAADVNSFRAYHAKLKMMGFTPDLVVVDYIGEMKDIPGIPTWESRFRIVRDLRGFATEEDFLCMTAMQPNRSARELQSDLSKFIDDDNLADAFGQTRPLDGLYSINQSVEEKKGGVARGFVVKSRSGKSRFDFFIGYDEKTLRMYEISRDIYKAKMSLVTMKDSDRTEQMFDDDGKFKGKKKKKDEDKDKDKDDSDE
jgi:KaiC/GvpD/RAD55 family RecA-like ATPase